MELAKTIAVDLQRREGRNLVAVGVYGSVARGEERHHSDVDLLVVVRRKRRKFREARQGEFGDIRLACGDGQHPAELR